MILSETQNASSTSSASTLEQTPQQEPTKSKEKSKPAPPCLQYYILGLKCSFESKYQLDPEIAKCSRCLRNKENICTINFPQPEPPKHRAESKTADSCLECYIQGLKCSFTSKNQLLDPEIIRVGKCSRCMRNGEGFCIIYSDILEDWLSPGINDVDLRERIEKLDEKALEALRNSLPLPRSLMGQTRLVKKEGLWREPRYLEEYEKKIEKAKKSGN